MSFFFYKAGQRSPENSGELGDEPDSGMLENIPPSVKERLARLQRENKQLRAKVRFCTLRGGGSGTGDVGAKKNYTP